MENNKYNVNDLVDFAMNDKPIDFQDAFSYLIKDRIETAIEIKKTDIAQNLYNSKKED